MLKSIKLSNPRKAQTQQKHKRQPRSHSLFFFFFIVSGRNCRFLAGATKKNAAALLFFFIVSSKFPADFRQKLQVSGRNCRFPAAIFTLFSAIHHIAIMSRLATLFAIAVAMAAIDNYGKTHLPLRVYKY
ncbi:hypothetical protein Hanom_Chr15g01369681 [Helianthus anomalus]